MIEKKEDLPPKQKDRMIAEALGEDIAVTPSDIYNQDFKRALLSGYNTREVDAFLERVADIVERLLSQVRYLREKTDEQRATIEEYREIEKTLRSALISSQKFSEDILASAKREAESLIEEARLTKAQAQIAAAKLPRKLARDIHVLEQQRSRLRREIMAILETHKSLLDSLIPEEDTSPGSFYDAGESGDAAEEDEDTDLPVVNIVDDGGDSPGDTGAFASFPQHTATASGEQLLETPPGDEPPAAEAEDAPGRTPSAATSEAALEPAAAGEDSSGESECADTAPPKEECDP